MDKLRNLLSNRNIGWRLISLVLAVLVWLICITYIDPPKSQTFTVKLTLLNEDALGKSNKILQNQTDLASKEIKIEVSGRTRAIDELNNSSFTAYIDLGKAEILNATQIGEYIATNVIVSNNNADVKITRQNPMEIGILLDEIIERDFPVKVTQVGEVKDGYVAVTSSIQKYPETIRIRGARTALSAISYMSINANINEAEEDVVLTDTPQAFDESGNEVNDYSFVGVKNVRVFLPVYKKAMYTIVPPELQNTPADGFVVAGTPERIPHQVEVMGPAKDVVENTQIILDPIDVSGRRQSFSVEYDLRKLDLGKTLTLVNPDDDIVTVNVIIEPEISKTLTIPVADLTITGLAPGMAITTETVSVTVLGRASLLEPLTKIEGVVPLSGITTEGTYNLVVEWKPKNGITIISGASTVRVVVRAEEAAPTASPSTTEDPAEE